MQVRWADGYTTMLSNVTTFDGGVEGTVQVASAHADFMVGTEVECYGYVVDGTMHSVDNLLD